MTRIDRASRASSGKMGSLFAALALLMLGNGLQSSLVGIRTQVEAFSGTVTGVVMAAYFAGFLAGSFVVPRFVASVGHVRVFAALASSASVAALLYSVLVSPVTWALMRLLTGACFAGLYVVAESWINTEATNETRGRLLSVYMVVVMGGVGLGQLLLNVADPAGFELFIISSVLISLAVVPVSLVRAPVPDFEFERAMPMGEFFRLAPLGVIAGVLTGAANAAVLGMGAVYATQAGLSTASITFFMAATLLGAVALQWPAGHLSDLFPRRRVLMGVALAASLVAILAGQLDATGPAIIGVTFVFGGLAFPMYSLAMSHINDMVPAGGFVASAAAFLFVSGIGSIAGPPVVAAALELFGPVGYWWSLAAFFGPVALFSIYRIARHARAPEHGFASIPPRVSPLIGRLIDRSDQKGPE